jgi:phosphatidylserine/phosphatidylglycerophosphate/cardiolipin synthase-like enzyme
LKNIMRKIAVVTVFLGTFTLCALVAYRISTHDDHRLKQRLVAEDGTVAHAYFSPEDDLRSLLISLINAERKSIRFAIYTFTDAAIVQALLQAAQRGVAIEALVDRSYGHDKYSKVCKLANARIPVWVYQTSANEREAGLMHNKFCLFEENSEKKSLLWTGSYNFTNRASSKNQENIIILDTSSIIEAFSGYFERLKSHSLQISGHAAQ